MSKKERLLNRTRPRFSKCLNFWFLVDERETRLLKAGSAQISHEFDLVKYIRLQKRVRALISILLTPKEQLLLKHDRRFYLSTDSEV